jgi:hypothetical protein
LVRAAATTQGTRPETQKTFETDTNEERLSKQNEHASNKQIIRTAPARITVYDETAVFERLSALFSLGRDKPKKTCCAARAGSIQRMLTPEEDR